MGAELYDPKNVKGVDAQQFGKLTASLAVLLAGGDASAVNIAGTTAVNAIANNRQLHQSETARIKLLAGGDPSKEARLTAAACAIVHCADGVPKDDPNYAFLKSLQDSGASLTSEQALLSKQSGQDGRTYGPLFQYAGVDQYLIDPFTQNKTGTRLIGALQGGTGLVGVTASGALCTTGPGCIIGAVTGTISGDYAQAGIKQAISGNATQPYGEQVLQSLGLSPQAAAITYGVLGIAPTGLPTLAQGYSKVAPQLDAALLNSGAKMGQNIDDVAATLAKNSTHTSGNVDRVVLGKWEGDFSGYVGDAKLNGGIWYQTDNGVFNRMTAGMSMEEKTAVAWKVNEYFLKQQLQSGVSKFEFSGTTVDAIKNGPPSFALMEVNFLEKNAAAYGYKQIGNTWIKVGYK